MAFFYSTDLTAKNVHGLTWRLFFVAPLNNELDDRSFSQTNLPMSSSTTTDARLDQLSREMRDLGAAMMGEMHAMRHSLQGQLNSLQGQMHRLGSELRNDIRENACRCAGNPRPPPSAAASTSSAPPLGDDDDDSEERLRGAASQPTAAPATRFAFGPMRSKLTGQSGSSAPSWPTSDRHQFAKKGAVGGVAQYCAVCGRHVDDAAHQVG